MRDGIKPFAEITQADERNLYFVRIDPRTGEEHQNTLAAQYSDIEIYNLRESVPDNIATQFDVARNIYIYAWFEYRFFNAAEAQVLIVLELALKERIAKDEIKAYIKKRNKTTHERTGKKANVKAGLKTYMEYCRDKGLVSNNGFKAWHRYPTFRARMLAEQEQATWAANEMERTGETEIELQEIKIEPLPPDESYNHVQFLIDNVNHIRNGYAHGSTNLYNNVLQTFEMVSDFINQLYPITENIEHRACTN
jgi:hypothetical protein